MPTLFTVHQGECLFLLLTLFLSQITLFLPVSHPSCLVCPPAGPAAQAIKPNTAVKAVSPLSPPAGDALHYTEQHNLVHPARRSAWKIATLGAVACELLGLELLASSVYRPLVRRSRRGFARRARALGHLSLESQPTRHDVPRKLQYIRAAAIGKRPVPIRIYAGRP